jgi:hypothetical protein
MQQEYITSFAGKFETLAIMQCWTFRLENLREISNKHSHGSCYSAHGVKRLSVLSKNNLRGLIPQPYRWCVFLALWSKKSLSIFIQI